MKFYLLSVCVIGILTDQSTSKPSPTTKSSDKTINYRLNTDIEPFDYVLEFTPYFENNANGKEPFTFDGICSISIKSNKPGIDTITLHKEDITIVKQNLVKVSASNGESIAIKSSEYDTTTSKYTLKLATPLAQDESYILNFKYVGRLQSDMHGFYRSSYTEGNVTKWVAATQMEPVFARKAFPCFDEPRFKATFSVIINRPAHFKPSLSNTAMVSTHYTSSNTIREYFEKTPRMSTYLVAFIVSEFECRENQMKSFSVCSRPGTYDQTEYSFLVGQKTLKTLEDLFDYKYNKHISKMTLAALSDFDAGAMENWGLLTFRESGLLFDSKSATSKDQQGMAMVIAHEQAHMWFGDLVTCDWWAHIWLNEGFARYFQYFATAIIEDSWGLDQQFVIDRLQTVFTEDSLENSLSLDHDANTVDEIQSKLGNIAYNKGASIIRMMNHTLGNEQFTNGLRNYLKTNALQTSVPEKLYAGLQEAVGSEYNITELMGSWVSQPGYPILDVYVPTDRKHILISQKRFLRNNPNHKGKTRWNVPITYASDKINSNFMNTKPVGILSGYTFHIELNDAIDWIVFNVQQSGYYRVNYDFATWSKIANILQKSHATIHVLNRAQVIDDALTFARAELISYQQAFDLVRYLKNEMNYVPWLAAFNNFNFILSRFKLNEASIFEKFELKLLKNVYNHLGFKPKESDSRLDIFNRNNVLKYACQFGHKQCITNSREEFNQLLRGNYTIPVDLASVVYCSAIAEGSEREWNFLWKKFILVDVATEKVTILNALGCAKQTDLIQKYLKLILSDAIRLQDKHKAFESTLTQRQNMPIVLDFIIENRLEINKAFESNAEIPKILTEILLLINTREQINKIENFINDNKLGLKSELEDAKLNLKWAEKNVPIIKHILKQLV